MAQNYNYNTQHRCCLELDTTTISDMASTPPLPEDWIEKYSDQHKRKFWKNTLTGEKSWKVPTPKPVSVPVMASSDQIVPPGSEKPQEVEADNGSGSVDESSEWEEKYSEKHGKSYYLNKKTKKKSWNPPSSNQPNRRKSLFKASSESSAKVPNDEVTTEEAQITREEEEINNRKKSNDMPKTDDAVGDVATPKEEAQSSAPRDTTAGAGGAGAGAGAAGGAAGGGEWEQKYSEKHNKPYYLNKKTRKKSWIAPHIVKEKETIETEKPDVVVTQEKEQPNIEFVESVSDNADLLLPLKLDSEVLGNFDSDLSRIEQSEGTPVHSPLKEPVGGQSVELLTIDALKQHTPAEVVATLNYYMKANAILEHNVIVADEKCADLVSQKDTYVKDNYTLQNTVQDYASQHHAREELIHKLQAQVSQVTQERDEVLDTLHQEHAQHAEREVQRLIDDESLFELKVLSRSQEEQIASLTAEVDALQTEKEDFTEKNNALNSLCDNDSRRISSLENNLTQCRRDNGTQQEKIQGFKSKCALYTKKINTIESELAEIKSHQNGIVEKNKSLITDNSKLIRKVNLLQKKMNHKSDCTPLKKLLASPAARNRFSTEGIDFPVHMIQSSSSSSATNRTPAGGGRNSSSEGSEEDVEDSVLDYSLSDLHTMEVDYDERFKRRVELEAGWVFVDVETMPLSYLMKPTSNHQIEEDEHRVTTKTDQENNHANIYPVVQEIVE